MRRPITFKQVAKTLVAVLLTLAIGFVIGVLAIRLYVASNVGEPTGAGEATSASTRPAYSA
jgi:hypothetical protein